jgi:subtilase family serine protease
MTKRVHSPRVWRRWTRVIAAAIVVALAGTGVEAGGERGDAGDELRASRRLRERAASLRAAPAAAFAPSAAAAASGITRDVGQIAVLEHDGSPYDRDEADGTPNYAARAALAQRFYLTHGDNYDFIVVFTNFEFETGGAIAFHSLVRNQVTGIGKPVVDNGVFFGSPGRLHGFVDMAAIDRYSRFPLSARAGVPLSVEPSQPGWRDTLNVLAHEVGHQWLARARYRDGTGASSAALLGRDGSHWSYLLDSDASIMYGSDWRQQPAGDWRAERVSEGYSPLDLYLMGLAPPARVAPFTLLRNPEIDPTTLPRRGDVVSAVPETVTVDQVVAAEGARQPPFLVAPKTFRAAFVFLTAPGVEPDPEDLAAVDRVRAAFVGHFFALTAGVGLVDTTLAEAPPGEVAPAPDLDLALAWLLAQQGGEGRFEDTGGSAVRDTGTVVETLREVGVTGDAYGRAVDWLAATSAGNTDFVLRRALALAPALSDAQKQALLASLKALQNRDGGFGLGPGYQSDPLDTALALRAWATFRTGGGDAASAAAIERALVHLRGARHASGLWPAVPLGEPSTVVTAHVLLALYDHPRSATAQGMLAPALAALLSRANPDGGFGESPSTPYATALVLQALLRGTPPSTTVDAAVAFLERTQATNGSWGQSAYATALVLRALKGGVTSNLTVPSDSLVVAPAAPQEGEVVRITAMVRNIGHRPSPPTVVRLFDGDPTVAASPVGERSIEGLEPGGEAAVAFDWPTADRAGSHVLYVVADPDGVVPEAREDDNAAWRAVAVSGKLSDLAIGTGDVVVSPYPPEEGEVVDIAVTVRNRGEQVAAPNVVRLFRGDPRLGGALIGEAGLGRLAVGESATVVIPWSTQGQPGPAELVALADPDHRVDESDETNNEGRLPVKVSGPIPPGPDLEIAQVSVDPPMLTGIPQAVAVRVLARNLSREDTSSNVELREQDGTAHGTQPVSIPARSASVLSFPVTVTAPGDRTFIAVADPAGLLDEADGANNQGAGVLRDPGDTFDVELLASEVTPSSAVLTVGDVLTVTAVVHNRGTAPFERLPVVLLHDAAEPAELARAFADVPPGGTTAVTLSWTVAFTADPLPLAVVADPFDLLRETNEVNNRVPLAVTVQASDRPNLAVSGADLALGPDPPIEGQPARVSLVVRNPSVIDAGPFVVRFFRGDPDAGGVVIGETMVPGLAAGGQAVAEVTWAEVDVRGAQGLTAVADADDQVDEYDETDNRAFRPFAAVGLPDLVVTAGDVSLDPAFPRAGQPVSARVKVLNLGAQPAPETVLRVEEGEGAGAITVAELTVGPLAPSEAQTLALSWTPASPAGDRPLTVTADASGVVREQDEGNNRARRVVVVQDADLYLTHPFFSPDGDGVQDETAFAWRAAGVASVSVSVSNGRGQLVRALTTGGPVEGSVVWDGRDERGRLLWDGTYTFTLASDRGSLLGRRQVILDTNHSPVHDAAGSGLTAIRNLTCALPDLWVGPAWLPAEDEAVFILDYSTEDGEFTPGLLRVGVDGQFAYVGEPDGWYEGAYFPLRASEAEGPPAPPVVSPDGREVLVLRDGMLHAVDLATGARRALATDTGNRASWSPDGRMIVAGTRVITRDGAEVGELPFARTGWVWSPDGQLLAGDTLVMRPDGSFVTSFEDIDVNFGATIEWRGDGKIFLNAFGFGEGEVGVAAFNPDAAVFVLDPATGAIESLDWVDALGEPPTAFDWSPDGSKVLYHVVDYLPATPYSRVARENGTGTRQLGAFHLTPGPRKSVGSWRSFEPGFVCAGNQDVFALVNLLNLTADLQVARLPANNGLQLRGTASDLNLDHHQLEWATEAAPEVWHPLGAASDTSVVSDEFTVWVPRAPGRYLVRLRVVDRAGNQKVRTRVVTWDRTPAIVNVTQSERLISPNGDGRRDAVRFDYLVQEPARLEVRVVGPQGESETPPLVRRFSFEYPDVGPAGFEWDGRDAGGRIVPDGRYVVYLDELPFRVEVDATPPDVAWSESEPSLTTVADETRVEVSAEVERAWHVVDPNLTGWTSPVEDGQEPIYEPEQEEDGEILFDERGAPRILYVNGRVADRRESVVIGSVRAALGADFGLDDFELTGTTIVQAPYERLALTAGDRAANASVLPVPPRAERLLLLMAVQANGRPVLLPPRAPGVVHRLAPVRTQFHLLSTTSGGEAVVVFRYQDRAGGAWSEAPVVPGWVADPKVLGLVAGREYRAEFVQRLAGGGELRTDTFLVRMCEAAGTLTIDRLRETPPQPVTDAWRATVETALGEPIRDARLEIKGTGDNVGFHQVVRLAETAPGSGRFVYQATTPAIEDCDAPEVGPERAGLTFEAVLVTQSGTVHRGSSECLRLLIGTPQCQTDLFLSQKFRGCDGTPDELLLGVDAQGPSSARVLIERGPADDPVTVAELTIGRRTLALDATGVPQGGLPVRARLYEPGTGTTLKTVSLDLVVDRTPPEADVVEPPEGGAVCVSRDPELGVELARLSFVADDAHDPLAFGPGRFRFGDGSWEPLVLTCSRTDFACLAGQPPARGAIVTRHWRVDRLASGDYAIEQTFCDPSGNRAVAPRRFFLTKLPPTIAVEGVSRAVFSPNGDGRADQTAVTVRLNQSMRLTAEVRAGAADGPLVETLFTDRTHFAGTHTLAWQGRPGGQTPPDGVYVIVVRGLDACGGGSQVGARVQIDNTPPVVEIAAPGPGSLVSSAVDVLGRAHDGRFTSYELSFGEGVAPSAWTTFGGAAFPVGRPPTGAGLLGPWVPPAVPGPEALPFTLRLTAFDEAENEGEVRVTVDVGPRVFLDGVAVRPTLFSPNGDERRETVTIEYRLLLPGRVTLQVRSPDSSVVRTLESGVDHGAETVAFVWDGTTDGGTPAGEGDLVAFVRVEDPASGSSQQQTALFTLDRTPPALALQRPAEGAFLPRSTLVLGSAADVRLSEWRVSAATEAGAVIELGRGTEPVPAVSELGGLDALADGVYTLLLQAEDAAQNRSTSAALFTVDSVPPHVAIELAEGAVLRKGPQAIAIRGSASDVNLQEFVLSYGPGPSPGYFVTIRRAATGGHGILLGEWTVASLPDGDYTLRLTATDKAGQTAEAEVTVSVDGTPPEAAIAGPAEDAYVIAPTSVVGTARDAHLESWRLEMAPGEAAGAFQWSPVAEGTAAVGPDAELAAWAPLPPDGRVTLRLTVRDRAGFGSAALRTVTVDQTPPATPTGLAADTVNRTTTAADVRLRWNANTEPDRAGYLLSRDETPLNETPVPPPTHTDPGRPDGSYLYAVAAVDRAGNQSSFAPLQVRVDLTAPVVDLLRPVAGARLSGTVDVRGTAFSPDDFKEYRLLVGAGAEPAAFTLLRRSTVPVAGGTLGSWTAVGSGPHLIALEAEDTSGNSARATVQVVVDNDAPAAPVLTAVTNVPAADALTATWTPSPDADVAGYLVYRNGRVANAPGVVIGELAPFLVPPPTYADPQLPDGEHCYRVVAMDQAGNLSPPSNEICRALDNRAPHALLLEPPDGTRFDYPLHLVAFTPDTDVAAVRFQYRAQGGADWTDLGVPDVQLPYEAVLDPAALAFGPYELRAVATDTGGRIDPAPELLTVVYGDATPPQPPADVTARVDGDRVEVSWTANTEGDLAGYRVFRDGDPLPGGLITSTLLVDLAVPRALHRYQVIAVDADGNQSAPAAAAALVYQVVLHHPYPITTDRVVDLAGDGAELGTSVHIERDGESIAQVSPPTAGAFGVPAVALNSGGNVLLARGVDDAGNRSLPSDVVVVISNEAPPAVTGLAAAVTDHVVDLAWDAVTDPELAGYAVRRNDQPVTPSVPQTDAVAFEASEVLPGFEPENAFDGDPSTEWLPSADAGTWTVTFPSPVLVEKVGLRFGSFGPAVAARYRIEVGWEGRFLPLVTVTENQETEVDDTFRAPFLTDRLRVVVEGGSFVGLAEVSVTRLDVVSAAATTFTDPAAPDGTLTYAVTAIDRYGAEGPAGSARAPVGDTQRPGRPSGLVAAVEGADVALVWSANPEPDIDRYVVIRDGERIATTPSPAYRDERRPNAVYQYQVLAVDLEGSESEPSDPATAVVAVSTTPDTPVILVPTDAARPITIETTAVPVWGRAREGDLVLLTVNGALAAGTTAGPLLSAQGTWPWIANSVLSPDGRESAHAVFGASGFVRVTGVHTGTFRDVATAVGFPVPLAFSADGRSLAYRDGVQLRVVDLDRPGTPPTVIDVAPANVDRASFSPDGGRVALNTSRLSPSQQYTLRVYDRTAASQRVLATATRPFFWPTWAPVGERVAVVAQVTSSRWELRVYDAVTGAVQVVDSDAWFFSAVSWSADGTRLAFTRRAPAEQVRIHDFAAGTTTDVTDGARPAFEPRFEGSGRWLSYHRVESDASGARTLLVARDLPAGIEHTVATFPYVLVLRSLLHQWDAQGYLHYVGPIDSQPSVFAGFEGGFAFTSVRLAPGENELVARAIDPMTAIVSEASETVRVTVSEASFPDLQVLPADLAANPALPLVGQPTLLRARVRNTGSAEAGSFRGVLRVIDPDGVTVFEQAAELAGLPSGEVLFLSATWTPAAAGAYVLEAVVDDTDELVEVREDDNAARRPLDVAATATLGLEVTADRDAYAAFQTALLDVRATNGGTPFAGTLRLSVETAGGDEVVVLDERTAALDYGQSLAYAPTWAVATTYAGDYRVVVRAVADGEVSPAAEASRSVRILPDVSVAGRIRPDRARVFEGEPAVLAVDVENGSANQPLAQATARVRVLGPAGGVTVFAEDLPVPSLLPGGAWDVSTVWPAAAPAGGYTAELTVFDAGGVALARAEAPLTVEPPVVTITGRLRLLPADVLRGDATRAESVVGNAGSSPLLAHPFRVDVVDGPTSTTLVSAEFAADLQPGQSAAIEVALAVSALAPGRYPVFLRSGSLTLGRSSLHVHAPITAPSTDSPADGARVATAHPTLVVNNASIEEPAALTYSFELYSDAALTQPVPGAAGIPEGPLRTSWTVPTNLGEDQTYYWRARATDGFSESPWSAVASFTVDTVNLPPLAPVPDQPAPGGRIATLQPELVVRNASDPERDALTYEFRLAHDPELAAVVASATGVAETLSFTAWRVPVSLDEDATYWWSARAFDGTGYSPWSDAVSFVVDTFNASPSAPTPLRPADGADVTTLAPELAVANATDLESDPLSYRFEIDVSPAFDSAEKQVSPPVPSGVAETAWTPPLPLRDNTAYYWRAAANDGRTTGPFAGSRFFVDLANEPPGVPVPLSPAAGAVVTTPTPTLRARNAVDPEADALTYEFEVRDTSGTVVASVSGVPEGPTETTWPAAPALVEDQSYAWRVRASDAELAGGWSDLVPFRVNAEPDPPTAPTLFAPPEGAVVGKRRPALAVVNAVSPEGLDLTYEFELYSQAADGTLTLVDAAAGVPSGVDRTSFTPTVDLADGAYSWRSRARDVNQPGPWMASAHFTVRVDEPPAPPTGLTAVPGDARVTLAWDAHPEPDVVAYRVYRSLVTGGPYDALATVATPSFLDAAVVNGTTYFYVVTALDAASESGISAEAAGTPRASEVVEAEVRYSPDVVDGGCLGCRCRRDDHPGKGHDWSGSGGDHDDRCEDRDDHDLAAWDETPWIERRDRDRDGDRDDDHHGGGHPDEPECPAWLYATIELPRELSPFAIDRRSLRLAGDVRADARYAALVDQDRDGIRELRVRFRFERVAAHLTGGVNTLHLTGRVDGRPFQGSDTVEVRVPRLDLRVTPRTIKLGAHGQWVLAVLSVESGCGRAADVDVASLRLNGVVPARVVSASGRKLILKFDRQAVEATLSVGWSVEVRLTGRVLWLPFVAVDHVRVIR